MMNSTRLLYGSKLSGNLLRLSKTSILQRTFLSEAYQCQESWNKRFESQLLSKINPVEFFLDLDQKFQRNNRVHAVDVDIFANIIKDDSHAPEIADVLYKHRLTRETSFTLDSTHHAVVKYFISIGKIDELLSILNDRLNYGIFCDYYEYNLLMDCCIKQKDFASAVKVATFMMLQETFEHPISNSLAIYSCFKYLENPDTWQEPDPKTLVEEPKEEVKIRVRYIRNPYFDDHFDLWQPLQLVGKTLWMIGMTMDNSIGRTCQLRGLVLYNKYEQAISLLQKWKQDGIKEIIYKDVLPLIKKDIPETVSEDSAEQVKELQQLLEELESGDLYQGNFNSDIESMVKNAVSAHEQDDISRQSKLYSEWEEKRMSILQKQLQEIDKENRLEKIQEIKKELEEKERLLTFFENEEQIELQIEEKLEQDRKRSVQEKQIREESDENYVSPESFRKRN